MPSLDYHELRDEGPYLYLNGMWRAWCSCSWAGGYITGMCDTAEQAERLVLSHIKASVPYAQRRRYPSGYRRLTAG